MKIEDFEKAKVLMEKIEIIARESASGTTYPTNHISYARLREIIPDILIQFEKKKGALEKELGDL